MKILLLDIDNTLIANYQGKDIPRPYLVAFLTKLAEVYDIRFYTAGSRMRITDLCRVLVHQLGFKPDWLRWSSMYSLSRDNCKTVELITSSGSIEYKCLRKAAVVLDVDYSDIAYLIDDNYMRDNPDKDKRIQIQGFSGWDDGDTVLRDFDLNNVLVA